MLSPFSVLPSHRIAIMTDDPGEGGVAAYVHALACALAKLNLDVTIIQSRAEGPRRQLERDAGVKHHWLAFDTRRDFARTVADRTDAKAAFDSVRPTLILFANCDPFSHLAAKDAAIDRNIPFLVIEHYVWPNNFINAEVAGRLRRLREHYSKARAVVAVSADNLSLLHRFFGLRRGKGEVIHCGRPAEFFQPTDAENRATLRRELGLSDSDVLCLTVARLEPVKGFDLLLEAVDRLKSDTRAASLRFAWIGAGSLLESAGAQLTARGLTRRVTLLGQRENIAAWLDAADLFVLPSRNEGMPLSIMEAMAKGLAVIATAVSGIPEQLAETGLLIASPNVDGAQTVSELATALLEFATGPERRALLGKAAAARAREIFREERMVRQTIDVMERSVLPDGDYVSPGLLTVRPDRCFPHMAAADPRQFAWPYLRSHIPHRWYQDARSPGTGFLNRDEAMILYNTALQFAGKRALEIGCWLGWSTCHLLLGGVELDVIDPALEQPELRASVEASLTCAGLLQRATLVASASPAAVTELADRTGVRWPLIFIDGDHEHDAPLRDAMAAHRYATADAMILFHDLASPAVTKGLEYLRAQGWNVRIYSTAQIMGVAWRGALRPLVHHPDPRVEWTLPAHLKAIQQPEAR